MRCDAVLLLGALLVAAQAEGSLVDDEYERALRDEARRMECEDCPLCPPHPARCSFLVSSGRNYFYNVDGVKLKIEIETWHVKLICTPGVTLESASLPVFPTLTRGYRADRQSDNSVTLSACPAPRASGGIGRVLSRLNINRRLLKLTLDDVPPAPRLQPDLFAGLQHLIWLNFSAEAGLVLEPGLLGPLIKLQFLYLTDVRMSPATLAPRSTVLENVSLTAAHGSCSALRRLIVSSPHGTTALPVGWLQVRGEARCPRLRELVVYSCAMGGLPADALRGLKELRELSVTDCRELRALPHGVFNDTQVLRRLVLANNALEVLPEGIFTPMRKLMVLDLSGNMLGALGDGAAALGGVRSLTSLRVLVLNRNPLGDTCSDATITDYELPLLSIEPSPLSTVLSPLHNLRALQMLSLAHTGASRLCVDWRIDLYALTVIKFSYNNFTVLKYLDMQWYNRECAVDLRGNPLSDVIVTSEDYARAPDDLSFNGRGVLQFDADLASSCSVYWAARALREGLLRVRFVGLTCGGRPLQIAPLDDMTCAETDACPERCTCSLRPSDDTLVLRCAARRDLPDFAPVAGLARRFELGLAGAHLASLPDALPASLRVLDLRNASLPATTERQAAVLFEDGRDVLLGEARVACACAGDARPTLARVLVARLQDVRCVEDGKRAHDALPCTRVAELDPRSAWPGALGALAVATLVLGTAWCAARRGSRLRVRVFLLARGLCPTWTRRDDNDDCPYDVFIWFSRHDFTVVSQIVRELEAGPRPLRVCVHYRDWRAGESILTQIQQSVVQSRRTLVLVSAHASRSVWARAVLREAAARALRDVTPRLVVALLQPAPPPGLDPELAHYVRANTYARWGDKSFWDRLRLALPPGRPCATAAVPPRATAVVE